MRAMIAMSGGVDSSVAAWLLREQGYACEGVTLRLYRAAEEARRGYPTCCSEEDVRDAAEVAFQLDIPHGVLDYTEDFRAAVIEPFCRAYARGRTPNPCIECNRSMKFEKLLFEARIRGFDVLATGHYARICRDEESGRYLLKKALDATKDQSYVLYMLRQSQLKHLRFPLGELTKDEVRQIAAGLDFVNARKHDSQDICFVPDRDYAAFLERQAGQSWPEGDFLDEQGRVIGRHRGIIHYTVGQRRGLNLPSNRPWYVKSIDPAANTVTLCRAERLCARTVWAEDVNWIALPQLEGERRVRARVLCRQAEQPATARMEGGLLRVDFDEPQRAPTPGQALVLYDGDAVLGGGTIWEVRT